MPANASLTVQAPAKINLFLNLRGLRPDGYHELCTLLQTVDLADTLTLTEDDAVCGLQLTCSDPALELNPRENLVAKAYYRFWEVSMLAPLNLRVHLEKRVPVRAGLGGGSSDAAAMLLALNRLTGHPLSDDKLRWLAALLGSDVPFFLAGGTCLATGRGERLEPVLPGLPALPLVIAKPRDLDIATADAYQAMREHGVYRRLPVVDLLRAIESEPTPDVLGPLLYNDFEGVLGERHDTLWALAGAFREAGLAWPLLSGSGSAMFAFLPPEVTVHADVLAELEARLSPSRFGLFVAETLPARVALPAG